LIFDEAHNTAPASEEVSSFEIKASYLEKCLIELRDLQEGKSHNEDKEWKTTND
jgi:Rad3-related DNA helicase